MNSAAAPGVLALFEKRFAGDDALMQLAQLRFQQSAMGAEMHAGTPAELAWTLRFRPSADLPVVVHLPRGWKLLQIADRLAIHELAARAGSAVHGFVLHDDETLVSRGVEYLRAAEEINTRLSALRKSPLLFIEYAAGLGLEDFAEFFDGIRELNRVSACIDVGHVGIREIRRAFAESHAGKDICALRSQDSWSTELLVEIETAVRRGLPQVLSLVRTMGALGKPLHFHLHDGHPLSTFSPFGVSDHLGFLGNIPLKFEFQGGRSLPLMFGPNGLSRIVATALDSLEGNRITFTLEIHPAFERLPFEDGAHLFAHWTDKTNAEQMNHWLVVLGENRRLFASALAAGQATQEPAESLTRRARGKH